MTGSWASGGPGGGVPFSDGVSRPDGAPFSDSSRASDGATPLLGEGRPVPQAGDQPLLPGPVVAIVGPTASGKSALADLVAQRLGTSVVSVDAMQVYRGMDIGTAKTPVAERLVPLEMVDVADLGSPYSVALFQRDGRAVMDRLLAEGRTPVLCGGTGLYLDALVDEMDFPSGDVATGPRSRYEALAEAQGAQAVWEELRRRDPRSADAVHPHNVRRVIRALEMADQGVSYADQRQALRKRPPRYEVRMWALELDRQELYRRIDRRVDQMFLQGLVGEVQGLREAGLGEALTARQAIGYKEVIAALDGHITLDEARERVKQATRRYAKRQLSWIRRDGRARPLDVAAHGLDGAVTLVCKDLRQAQEARG